MNLWSQNNPLSYTDPGEAMGGIGETVRKPGNPGQTEQFGILIDFSDFSWPLCQP